MTDDNDTDREKTSYLRFRLAKAVKDDRFLKDDWFQNSPEGRAYADITPIPGLERCEFQVLHNREPSDYFHIFYNEIEPERRHLFPPIDLKIYGRPSMPFEDGYIIIQYVIHGVAPHNSPLVKLFVDLTDHTNTNVTAQVSDDPPTFVNGLLSNQVQPYCNHSIYKRITSKVVYQYMPFVYVQLDMYP